MVYFEQWKSKARVYLTPERKRKIRYGVSGVLFTAAVLGAGWTYKTVSEGYAWISTPDSAPGCVDVSFVAGHQDKGATLHVGDTVFDLSSQPVSIVVGQRVCGKDATIFAANSGVRETAHRIFP